MTTIEMEEKLRALFHGGERRCRELRLSDEEARYVADHCAATLRPLGEAWYEISFMGGSNFVH